MLLKYYILLLHFTFYFLVCIFPVAVVVLFLTFARCSYILLLRVYHWAVVILGRLLQIKSTLYKMCETCNKDFIKTNFFECL